MGIEAIGSISGACLSFGNVGSAVGSVASAVGRGASSVGRISVEASAPAALTTIVNEGSVNLADLKNTVPLGEIRFNEPLLVPDVLAEAESMSTASGQAPLSETRDLPWWEIATSSDFRRSPRNDELVETRAVSAALPDILKYPKPQVIVSPALEPLTKTENATMPQTELVEKKKELVEESVTKENPRERAEEKAVEKRLHLEDEEASAQRKQEIRGAIVKARAEADRLGLKKIAGWLVAKFLPPEHEGNRSQIIKKKGPDGSYQETVEEIAGVGELESEEQAVSRFDKVVAEKKPVKWGKEGTPVENKDVARVFKYRLVKPVQAHAEMVKRVIKKKMFVPQLRVVPVAETSLEELNPALAGVFPKH